MTLLLSVFALWTPPSVEEGSIQKDRLRNHQSYRLASKAHGVLGAQHLGGQTPQFILLGTEESTRKHDGPRMGQKHANPLVSDFTDVTAPNGVRNEIHVEHQLARRQTPIHVILAPRTNGAHQTMMESTPKELSSGSKKLTMPHPELITASLIRSLSSGTANPKNDTEAQPLAVFFSGMVLIVVLFGVGVLLVRANNNPRGIWESDERPCYDELPSANSIIYTASPSDVGYGSFVSSWDGSIVSSSWSGDFSDKYDL